MELVKAFFDNYASALLSYSAEEIAAHYQAPMAVYSDQGVMLVEKDKEVKAFWENGVEPYKHLGIVKTRPTVLSGEKLSDTVHIAKVNWVNTDVAGYKVSEETNVYILSDNGDGLKITGLIIMG